MGGWYVDGNGVPMILLYRQPGSELPREALEASKFMQSY